MTDGEIRKLVNDLTQTARYYEGCGCLREALAKVVKKHVPRTRIIKNRPARHGDERPSEFSPAKTYPVDSQGRCIECQGWGCHVCCSSDAEIRACQGIFG